MSGASPVPASPVPASPHPPARRPLRGAAVGVLAVIGVWFVSMIGPFSFLMPVFPIALLVAGRRRAALLTVLLSPLVVTFVIAVVSYCRGTATLADAGLPGTTFYNLDPDLRCGRSTSGCIVDGDEWVVQWPNNTAVSLLTRLFGPQRGAYTGPYPTEAEAVAAVTGAPAVTVADLTADRVPAGGRVVRLDKGVGAGLLNSPNLHVNPASAEAGPIRAAVWKDACLILRLPAGELNDPHNPVQAACIAVCDLRTGRPFAYYGRGDYEHRTPPVPWSR